MPFPDDGGSVWCGDVEAQARANLEQVEQVIADDFCGVQKPAGVILEPIQGEGGVNSPPPGWLRGLAAITRRHKVPLILDEVQTGFGRTGDLFAFLHEGVVPDVLVLSKAIGGGLPLSVIVYDRALDLWEPGSHAGTFRGNQLGLVAGAAAMREIITQNLAQNARERGLELRTRLEEIEHSVPEAKVRGRGLMLGVEFLARGKDGSLTRDGVLAAMVQARALANGLIVEVGGRASATVRFLPPINISGRDVNVIGDLFALSVREACASCA
jgi:diaminobutyrate-2-oxoglutarate transaminase